MKSQGSRGLKKKMAEFLRCQSSFISQVLHKTSHLTLEHAAELNQFFEHTNAEREFFLMLVQFQRAGNEELKQFCRQKIEELLQKRLVLKNRISAAKPLGDAEKQIYYSSWHFSAICVILTIPSCRSRESIAKALALPMDRVSKTLDLLVEWGLALEKNGIYEPTEMHMHLPSDSPMVVKHHMNWRLRAMHSLERERSRELHYSVALTLSEDDVVKLKAKIVEFVEEIHAVVRPSPPEVLRGLCLDFFEV